MSLFKTPSRNTKQDDLALAKKTKTSTKSSSSIKKGNALMTRINAIVLKVDEVFKDVRDDYIIIDNEKLLHDYITTCIQDGIISIDTETTGLDPMLDKCVGVCLYSPSNKAGYIPINHTSLYTGLRLDNQLTEEIVGKELARLNEVYTPFSTRTKVIMFNAKFDMRVLKNQLGVYSKCAWDCYLGARLLNENELSNQLKKLHQKYVLKGQGDAFSFEELFRGIPFNQVPIETAYLYASHDAIITYEYYLFQLPFLTQDDPKCIAKGLEDVAWVFHNIEMPCIEPTMSMEDNGIELDMEYTNKLSQEYNVRLKEKLDTFYKELDNYSNAINSYIALHPDNKLDEPINIASPTQLSILFYDILKVVPLNPKSPRGTGIEELTKIGTPLAKAILDYRGVEKLINTYIDKLPTCVNPNDGRIHCNFNQYGADTGRMSSNNPKLNWAYI